MEKIELADLILTLQKKILDEHRETSDEAPSSVFKSKKKAIAMKNAETPVPNSTSASDPAD